MLNIKICLGISAQYILFHTIAKYNVRKLKPQKPNPKQAWPGGVINYQRISTLNYETGKIQSVHANPSTSVFSKYENVTNSWLVLRNNFNISNGWHNVNM